MAAQQSNKPGWPHYTCAFLTVLTLVLSVALYMQNNAYNEREAAWTDQQKKANDATGAATRVLEQVNTLKKTIGHEFETVGAAGEQNATTVVGAMLADIALAGELAQSTYKATLLKLVEELNAQKVLIANKDAEVGVLNGKVQALETQYNERVKAEETAKAGVEANLATVTNDAAEERTKKDKEIDDQRNALKEVQDQLAKTEDEFKKAVEISEKKEKNLKSQITFLKNQIEDLRNYGFEKPLGEVVSVDSDSGTLTINLGEADSLPKRTTFSVYTKANSGVARGAEDIKGAIEVVRILGPHLALAKITQEGIPSDPITAKDPIYTPTWSPGRQEKLAFVGWFDFDGDGKDDREALHELMATNRALIGAEVDAKGVYNGRKIDHDTKFLVVGEIPDPTEITDPELRRAVEEIKKFHQIMKDEADQNGVTVVRKNDFLSYMGYKPQYKLYKSGDPRPNNAQGSRTNNSSYSSGKKTSLMQGKSGK